MANRSWDPSCPRQTPERAPSPAPIRKHSSDQLTEGEWWVVENWTARGPSFRGSEACSIPESADSKASKSASKTPDSDSFWMCC